jgi:hypothetical protein
MHALYVQENKMKRVLCPALIACALCPRLTLAADVGDQAHATQPAASSFVRPIPVFYVSAYLANPQIITVDLISGFTMRGSAADDARGVFFELEPGLGAWKMAVGHGFVGAHGMHRNWKGAFLRTWGDPWGMHPNESFVGGEFALGDFGLSFRVGAYGEVSGGPDNRLVSGGIGMFFN